MKRSVDIFVSLIAIVVFLPIFILVLFFVRFQFGSPLIFSQLRPGLGGKVFRIYKFRSMNDDLDSNGKLLPDAQRLGKTGALLRSTSLDELPALWNVLVGDMSLVGPRPLLVEYLPFYSKEQLRRHEVKPGITGWAQINGRNAISWEEKFALDVWYVDNRSIRLDLKILLLTIKKVFCRSDISAEGEATMSKFTGQGGV